MKLYESYLMTEDPYSIRLDSIRDTLKDVLEKLKNKHLSPEERKKLTDIKNMAIEMLR